jgi:AcrR family transcriptional regulator
MRRKMFDRGGSRVKHEKQDRRSQRTRRLITTAMMELLFERRYEQITVQDVLDRAGIGRSTFYSHYFDKEDVLASIAEQMFEMFRQQLVERSAGQAIVPALELFRHVYEHPRPRQFQAMLRGRAGELARERGEAVLSEAILQALTAACGETSAPSVPLPVVSQYLARAFLRFFQWWLDADMPYTPEQMDTFFQQLAMPGVYVAIGVAPASVR